MPKHKNHEEVLRALHSDPDLVIMVVARQIIRLGALSEWSMEDNRGCTEAIVRLATTFELPSAGDQTEEGLRFYGEAARALGLPTDLDNEDDAPWLAGVHP